MMLLLPSYDVVADAMDVVVVGGEPQVPLPTEIGLHAAVVVAR